jgi:hypothetical protein
MSSIGRTLVALCKATAAACFERLDDGIKQRLSSPPNGTKKCRLVERHMSAFGLHRDEFISLFTS